MNDIKRAARQTEDDLKQAWRKADGNESLGDKAANLGDRTKHAIDNVDDKLHEGSDKLSREAAYERGRADAQPALSRDLHGRRSSSSCGGRATPGALCLVRVHLGTRTRGPDGCS